MIKVGYESKNESYHKITPAATSPYSSAEDVQNRIADLKAAGSKPAYTAEIRNLEKGLKLVGSSFGGLESKLKTGISAFNKVMSTYHAAYDELLADEKLAKKVRKEFGGSWERDSAEWKNHTALFDKEQKLANELIDAYEASVLPILALLGKVKYTDGSELGGYGKAVSTDSAVNFDKLQRAAGAKGSKLVQAWNVA